MSSSDDIAERHAPEGSVPVRYKKMQLIPSIFKQVNSFQTFLFPLRFFFLSFTNSESSVCVCVCVCVRVRVCVRACARACIHCICGGRRRTSWVGVVRMELTSS